MEEKIEYISKLFFDFDNSKVKVEDIEMILSMKDMGLSALTKHDCDCLGWKLLQHSLYVQNILNKYDARKKYLKHQLNKCISKQITNYTGAKIRWELAEQRAINGDSAASELQEQLLECEMTISIGNNIAKILNDMSRKIEGFKYAK